MKPFCLRTMQGRDQAGRSFRAVSSMRSIVLCTSTSAIKKSQLPSLSCHKGASMSCIQRNGSGRRQHSIRALGRGNNSPSHEPGHNPFHDPRLDPLLSDYVEAKVDSVRIMKGSPSVVFLRLQDEHAHCLAVWIGDHESQALLREMGREPKARPLTHDVAKDLVSILGFRVVKVRITEMRDNTYYARIHVGVAGGSYSNEQDVDARPSDAINLAMRFKAPIFIHKQVAKFATPLLSPLATTETQAQIIRSVQGILAAFVDPTVMDTLQKELAVQEQRFKDAHMFQQRISHEMTHNRALRIVVAMETALNDKRFEEAARLRDEYQQLRTQEAEQQSQVEASWPA